MTAMPVIGPPRDLVLPAVAHRRSGGFAVLAARLPTVPLVHLRARFSTDGLATSELLAASLLDSRARGHSLRHRLEQLGATAEVSSDPDGIVLALAAQPDAAMELLAVVNAVGEGAPAGDEVLAAERVRLAALTQMTASDAGEAARRAALAAAYGRHRYAEALPTAGELAAVTGYAVGELLRTAELTSLVVVGDIAPEAVADAGAAGVRARSVVPESYDAPPPLGRAARWLDRPGSVQTSLRAVVAAPRLGATNRAAAEVLDMLVGNGWCSVFHRVLREKHGYGYHPSSELVDRRLGARLEISVDVASEVTGGALAVVEEELGRLAASPVDDDWLEVARRGALGALSRRLDSQAALAELLQELSAAGLSPAYVQEHAGALRRVTAADVQAVAAELLPLDAMSIALVGDRSTLAGQPSSLLLDSVR